LKRKKNVAKGFGETQKKSLVVRFKPDLDLPESLKKLEESLRKDRKHYLVGEVEIREVCYPTIFMPYYQIHEGINKLYSHTAFCPEKPPKVTQVLANKISLLVCRKLYNRAVKRGIGVNDYLPIIENEREDFLALAQSENKGEL